MSDPSNTPHHLELTSISKSYGRNKALNDVSLHVKRHEVLGLIGENGAGKSTLLKILGGIHSPDVGSLKIHGVERQLRNGTVAAASGIGVVHQEQSLIETLSVAENLSLGAASVVADGDKSKVSRFGFYRWKSLKTEGKRALERIGLAVSPDAKVGSLSFADRQMVEIAKAVHMASHSGNDPLIILDEPTSVLEKKDVERLEEEIRRLKEIGSVIFVSHRLDEIRRVCDRVYVLRSGRIVAERKTSELEDGELFYLMTGRAKVDRKPIKREGTTGRPSALDVHNATVSGQFRNVSLTVDAGQVHVLVGTRNSGREELCRAVFGLERLSSGTIAVAGKPSRPGSIRGAIDAGVGYLPSERKKEGMIAGLSVADNMILAHPDDSYAGPFARPAKQRETVEFWIRKLDVRPPLPGRDLNQLSGGNQQKVVLAKWAKDANLKLLMLDHPTRGVDPGAREHINALVDELCIAGAGVLLLADTLDEALMLGHRITVMRDGEISATFDNEGADAPDMALLMKYMV